MTTAASEVAPGRVATLFPGYFALVMATGIIAVGAWQQDLDVAASVLFAVASAALIVLLVLNLVRLVAHSGRFVADLTHHATGFAFLTAVAALDVVGSGAALIHGWWGLAWVCWIAAMVSWVVLLYPALLAVVLDDEKPDLSVGINGTWFLLTVSTESIAVLGAVLLVRTGPNQAIELIALSTFVLGIVLYLIVMTLLFLRWTFRPVSPAELQPPSWIAAGALAITVLAGSTLLSSPDRLPRIERLAPFLEGLVLLAWATATFWLPVMVAMGVWRHGIRRVPLSYHPSMWSMVFPIGMYGVATFRMIPVTGFTGLDMVPKVVLGIATVAWAATAVGTVRSLTSR